MCSSLCSVCFTFQHYPLCLILYLSSMLLFTKPENWIFSNGQPNHPTHQSLSRVGCWSHPRGDDQLVLVQASQSLHHQWFLVPLLSISHVFACSFLYTVNARKGVAHSTSFVVPLSNAHGVSMGGLVSNNPKGHQPTECM